MPLNTVDRSLDNANEVSNRSDSGYTSIDHKMISLYQTIISTAGDETGKVFQFISCNPEEGCSRIVRQLGRTISDKLGKSVLIIDTNTPHVQAEALNVSPKSDIESCLLNPLSLEKAITPVAGTKLHLAVLSSTSGRHPTKADSGDLETILKDLSEKFDMILIDSPPASESAQGLTIAPKVGGTIIVIEAAKTRWQVVAGLQEKIEKYGGTIMGVVLNKRRDYIPKFIYDRI